MTEKSIQDKRVFLVVLDSFGIGYEPDAEDFGDVGSNTLGTIRKSPEFAAATLGKLGLFHIDGVEPDQGNESVPLAGAYGRLREKSNGKDTTTGHWEIGGIVSEKPFPTFPQGFPEEILKQLREYTKRGVLCNLPYSGTEVIKEYGREHQKTGDLIVYTSADSVLQIAAHEDIVPVETLYDYCAYARKILVGKYGVGRVIARPFKGSWPEYYRTPNRHDFSLVPSERTMLDVLCDHGYETYGIGKIYDIFAGKGIQNTQRTTSNADGMKKMKEMQKKDFCGLCFVNLVDFDMVYGHRNDIDGYAAAIREFDTFLPDFLSEMRESDILMITADHGCDPGYPGTDHTREYIPFLAYGNAIREGANIGTRETFADISATIQDIFDIQNETAGESFKEIIWKRG